MYDNSVQRLFPNSIFLTTKHDNKSYTLNNEKWHEIKAFKMNKEKLEISQSVTNNLMYVVDKQHNGCRK